MKALKLIPVLFGLTILMSGCLYNFIAPESETPIDPEDPNAPELSYSQDINPIFNDGNNCTSCHKTGGPSPDLTTENSYASINNSKYINRTNPDESGIYLVPHPDGSEHSQKKYTITQANTVLLWITQGAQNN